MLIGRPGSLLSRSPVPLTRIGFIPMLSGCVFLCSFPGAIAQSSRSQTGVVLQQAPVFLGATSSSRSGAYK